MPRTAGKLERLLNLVALLLETPRPLSADEIRARVPGYPDTLDSFRRTFERDKDDLREMGVPLQRDEVPGRDPPIEGYRIPKDQYYLPDPRLEPDELAALHLAASAVRLDGVEGVAALWKLGGAPRPGDTPPVTVPAAPLASLPADPNLVSLFAGVTERRAATFSYRGERRTVDPYRLDFAKGRWYVTGYDHGRGEERHFRLDRMEGEVQLGRPRSFRRPETEVPGVRLQPWQLGDAVAVRARIVVDADQAAVAVSELGGEAVVEWRDDGSVVVELEVTNPAGLRTFVLGFLDHAEVLSPPELRADVVAWLERLVAR